MIYLWRVVDDEGTVLDVVVQRWTATRLLRRLIRSQGVKPERIFIDNLGLYGVALKELGMKRCKSSAVEKYQSGMLTRLDPEKRTKSGFVTLTGPAVLFLNRLH